MTDEATPTPHHPIPDEGDVGREYFEGAICSRCKRRKATAFSELCNQCGCELAAYRLGD